MAGSTSRTTPSDTALRRWVAAAGRRRSSRALTAGVAGSLLLAGAAASALAGAKPPSVSLAVGDVAAEDWSARGITLSLVSPDPTRVDGEIAVERVMLPEDHGQLDGVTLSCVLVAASEGGWSCGDGSITVDGSPWSAQSARWSGSFVAGNDWSLRVDGLRVDRGRVDLQIVSAGGETSVRATLADLPLARVVERLPPGLLPDDATLSGRLAGTLDARLDDTGPTGLNAELVYAGLAYAGPDGRHAGENLRLAQRLALRRHADGWRFDASVDAARGALYIEPVFVDAAQHPLRLRARGLYRDGVGLLAVDNGRLSIGDVVRVDGNGQVGLEPLTLRDLAVVARSDDVGALYTVLAQPYLIGTPADSLTADGRLGLVADVDDAGVARVLLNLDGVGLDDAAGRYAVQGLDASIAWARDDDVPASRLDVDAATLYHLPLDGFAAEFQFAPDRAWLVRPVALSLLGGRVGLDRFELDGALLAGDAPRWVADASIDGISLEALTTTLGWPPFGGTANATLSGLRYADRRLDLGGGIVLRAFGGVLTVDPLTIEDPLGLVPVLEANVALDGLDLAALTETFAFGRIEGEIDGMVEGLRLVAWQPDRFDLHLFTPPDSPLRRRISQRAVENLTELGSGVPAGLSGTVLTLFDDFAYRAIDLRVSLRGDIAELDGMARPDGGYYLVRGAGLPRIDVIGRNRRVAWRELVDRLRQIRLEGARIEPQ